MGPALSVHRVVGIRILLLYVQEVVTLQNKYLIYLHKKMSFTPFINYYDTLGWILGIRLKNEIILGYMNLIG